MLLYPEQIPEKCHSDSTVAQAEVIWKVVQRRKKLQSFAAVPDYFVNRYNYTWRPLVSWYPVEHT